MKNILNTSRDIIGGVIVVCSMAALISCSDGMPLDLDKVYVSDLRFLPEDFEGMCISHFTSDQSRLEYLDAFYSADEDAIVQKINISFEHDDNRIFDQLLGGEEIQPGIFPAKNADQISIKIEDEIIKPRSVSISSADRLNRIWSMEVYVSLKQMPFGKFAQTRKLTIMYGGKPFHEFRFLTEPQTQKLVNQCLDSSMAEASEYVAAWISQANGTQNAPASDSYRPARECTAVVVKPSLPAEPDGSERQACFPGIRAGDPPVCATPVDAGTVLRPSQLWLKDGVRVSLCEKGGYCYPASSVRFDPACDDPRSVGYFEVE